MIPGFHWTQEEIARCAALWSQGGLSTHQIVKEIGRSGGAIFKKMRACKVQRGSVPSTRRNFITRDARPWTADEIAFLTTHWGGASAFAIGEKLGRNRNSVIGKAHRLYLGDAPVGRPLAAKPVVVPPPIAPLPLPPPIADFTRLICPCNGHNPCQPGYGLCNICLTARQKPNPRASMSVGLMRSA